VQMSNVGTFEILRKLEVSLHQPEVRSDRDQVDRLLHESFIEFGRSGQMYTKAEILEVLSAESSEEAIFSQSYSLAIIEDGVALLTYKSARITANGELSRYTLRSSLWQYTEPDWQMRFHQGTATNPFEKSTP
jgi:hypothetical protein